MELTLTMELTMNKAGDYSIPVTTLEKEVARLALLTARRLLGEGKTIDEAVEIACHDSWAEWTGWTLAVLKGERTTSNQGPSRIPCGGIEGEPR